MKISIIIPFKNAAPWLEETISSIQKQKAVWELICVDDHSTDNGREVIERFKDSRIRVISNRGTGIIAALQLGLELTTGDFITRMDADDVMTDERLTFMHDTLVNSPAKTVVTGKVKYFSEGTLSEGFSKYEQWINERIDKDDHYDHIYRECVVASPNWMVRKNDLIEAGIFEKLKYPEDYDLVFHWFEKGFKIKSLQDVTLMWRDHLKRTSKNSEVYNQRALFTLKINWFIKLHSQGQTIGILGAGTKGKMASEILNSHDQSFGWYDLNHNNFNSPVNGQMIKDYNLIHEDQLLISIYPKQRDSLLKFIESKGYTIGVNAWFL